MIPLLVAGLAALAVAAAAAGAAIEAGPADAPKSRSLHHRATPTGGGVAILLGFGVGALAFARQAEVIGGPAVAGAVILSVLMALLGAADDVLDLPARFKLLTQGALALAFCLACARVERLSTPLGAVTLGPVIGVLGSALWIIVVSNTVNFMDGANGLAPGAMVIVLAGLGLAGLGHGAVAAGGLALIGAAAGLGFLPWNLPGGRIFQGDAGALFSSTLFAALALAAAGTSGEGAVSLWFGPTALLSLLTDVFLTLLARARRGARLLDAHREHLFQRWLLAKSATHADVSLRVWGLTALSTGLALAIETAPVWSRSLLFAAGLAASVFTWRRIDRRVMTCG
jgi:UDP-GlcNAc:undecaprenyl-phosphate GlcNAc-1-phosphate transferase